MAGASAGKSNDINKAKAIAGRLAYLRNTPFFLEGYGALKNKKGRPTHGAVDPSSFPRDAHSMSVRNHSKMSGTSDVKVIVIPARYDRAGNCVARSQTIYSGANFRTPSVSG